MNARKTLAWVAGSALLLSASLYMTVTHTRLGFSCAFLLREGHLNHSALRVLRCMDAANPHNELGRLACLRRAELSGWDVAGGGVSLSEALEAADRYLDRVAPGGNPDRVAWAWYLRANAFAGTGQYAKAEHVLEQGLAGHWSEPWAGFYSAERIYYLAMAGRRREALRAFEEFASDHPDSQCGWEAAEHILRAFPRDQTPRIRSYLERVSDGHPRTALAKAIGQVLAIPAEEVPPYTRAGPNLPGPMPPSP